MLTPEQKAIRETGVGSSEIAAVVGVNPWRSALDVFWSKRTPGRPPLLVEGDVRSASTEAGDEFEEPIVRLYARRTGTKLRRSGTLRHRSEPWILATPDRLVVGARRGVEVKLVGGRVAHHWDDGIPDYVLVQVDWQMLVLDYDAWDVASMFGPADLRITTVERDREREELLVEAAREFWFDYVLKDTPPPPVNEAERAAYLKRRYPMVTNEMAESTPEVDAIIGRYFAAQKAEEEASGRKQAAANDLLDWLGERRGVRGDWGTASAPIVRDRVDWKAMARELAGGAISEDMMNRFRGEPARKLGVYPKRTKT